MWGSREEAGPLNGLQRNLIYGEGIAFGISVLGRGVSHDTGCSAVGVHPLD